MPDFPAALTLCRAKYSRNLIGEQTRTECDGHTRCRRRVRRRGVTDTLCCVCSENQCQTLVNFQRQVGDDWFNINLPDYQGLSNTTARFNSELTITPIGDGYEISASLYIPQPDMMPNDQLILQMLAFIGITDGQFSQPLHQFVHNQWPLLWKQKS